VVGRGALLDLEAKRLNLLSISRLCIVNQAGIATGACSLYNQSFEWEGECDGTLIRIRCIIPMGL
jgi:hypothetical protein